jgi:CDP-diacylglycerol--serine O-phosphatidyltransferase
MSNIFPPVDPYDGAKGSRGRFRAIPVRAILPNLVTLLSLSAGLTAIRLTFEERYELAIYFILASAVLDGLDGRIARFLRSTSRFGAELDSLSDFLAFGVAPAVLMFGWLLHNVKSFGWLTALVFAIAGALRLARFNAALDREKPAWQGNFFTGVPAPAGALSVLLPLYLAQAGVTIPPEATPIVIAYVLLIAFLMVSRIPTFSGKKLGRVRRDLVLPLLVGLVVTVALIASFPFEMLAVLTVGYLMTVPFGWRAWNRLAREHGAREEEITFEARRIQDEPAVEPGRTE